MTIAFIEIMIDNPSELCYTYQVTVAGVAELADARDLKSREP